MQAQTTTTETEREQRQKRLLKLLQTEHFTAQSEVARALRQAGYEVTQSSISRDFRELGIIKAGGRYIAGAELSRVSAQPILQRLIKAVDTAGGNLLVIKTAPGAANVVADEMDKFDISGLVGTVAGDNTIFVATKNRQSQAKILQRIKML